jgi:hypothetical protein
MPAVAAGGGGADIIAPFDGDDSGDLGQSQQRHGNDALQPERDRHGDPECAEHPNRDGTGKMESLCPDFAQVRLDEDGANRVLAEDDWTNQPHVAVGERIPGVVTANLPQWKR